MTRTNSSAPVPRRDDFAITAVSWWPSGAWSWMVAAFVVTLALAAIVLAIFGTGLRGTDIALRVTARWCFLLFWFAYAGGAIARLGGPRFGGLVDRGRELGLAFAAAMIVHVGLVLRHYAVASEPVGAMLFFWAGIACTYLLALFSLPRLRDALGPFLWRIFRAGALDYIALVFAADFILAPLQDDGLGRYPLSYVPFALMLVGGAGLRLAAFAQKRLRSDGTA
jgi:hypothetical protein